MPRAGLTSERVVAEAAEVVDDVGHDRLTLAAVADRFGVAVPSLYKHVGGLGDLRRRLAARAVAELGEALTGALAAAGVAASRGDRLHALADAYRGYARRHPGRYAATLRAPDAGDADHLAASRAVLATVDEVLDGYGLDGADAVDATRAIRSALHGFVAIEAAGGYGLPHDVDRSYRRLVDALDRALAGWR